MKKLVMLVLVAVMAASTCFAQMGNPEERLKREIDGLTSALSLTQDQVAKVTPIVTEAQKLQMEAFQKMRDSGDMDRDKMRAEMMKMRADTDTKIKAILTADQKPKLDAFRKQQDEERAKRMQEMQQNR